MNPAAGPVLRGIHMPPPPGWWPPAPGWWVLAVILLVVLVLLGRKIWRRRLPKRRWRVAGAELTALLARHAEQRDDGAFAAGVSQLLRRCVRLREPKAVGLHGDAWHTALCRLAPDPEAARPLVELDATLYRVQAPLEAEAVARAARRWLRHVLLDGSEHA